MLELKDICKTYTKNNSEVKALDHLSISVKPGEFVTVTGPSGCGKTTLLLTAGGLLKPTMGEALIDGKSLYTQNQDSLARFRAQNIGFVFQQYHLIPYLTVLENIQIPDLAHPTPNSKEAALKLIKYLGLDHRINHKTSELSAGEKQRTALARALLYNPKILLADEITGNLDQKNAENVLSYLKDFASNGGTVLMVTHDSRAADAADRSIKLHQGKLEA